MRYQKTLLIRCSFFIATENKKNEDSINSTEDSYLDLTGQKLQQFNSVFQERLPLEKGASEKLIKEIKQIKIQIDKTEAQLASAASPEEYQKLIDIQTNAKAQSCQA